MPVDQFPLETQIGAQTKADAAAVQGLAGYDERVLPSFTRYASNPVLSAAAQNPAPGKTPAASVYWPYVVNAGAIPGLNPDADWFMYYSTDHDGGLGGVYLATADSPYGPWTSQGQVYVDDTVGAFQTENASVIWNDDESLFFMFYKVFGVSGSTFSNGMVTCLATSPDGITWTRVGIVLDQPTLTAFPGNGQIGYVRPFRIGRQWWMHLMISGASYPCWGLAQSHDGRTWQVQGRPIMYGCDALADVAGAATPLSQNQLRVEWNSGDIIWWRGRLWWLGIISNFTSGGTAKNARLAMAPVASNMRSLLGPVQYLLHPPTGSNESVNYRASHSHVYQGRIFLTYQCDSYFNLAVSN